MAVHGCNARRDKAAAIADKNSESHPRELAFANAAWLKLGSNIDLPKAQHKTFL